MDRKRRVVEVALELEAGLLDELFVVGIVGNRRKLAEDVRQPHQPQIDEQDGVGLRQQPCRFRRGAASQINDGSDGGGKPAAPPAPPTVYVGAWRSLARPADIPKAHCRAFFSLD